MCGATLPPASRGSVVRAEAGSPSEFTACRFLWDVTAKGLLSIKLHALERVLQQRQEILAALQPVPAAVSGRQHGIGRCSCHDFSLLLCILSRHLVQSADLQSRLWCMCQFALPQGGLCACNRASLRRIYITITRLRPSLMGKSITKGVRSFLTFVCVHAVAAGCHWLAGTSRPGR